MKIKKITPYRVFYPSKKIKLKDTLHVFASNEDNIRIDKTKISIKDWGLIVDISLKKKNHLKFMGDKIQDHLIFIKDKNKLRKYCNNEKQKLIPISEILKFYKC